MPDRRHAARPALDAADLRALQVFVGVVEAGGFSAASARLDLGLSTISGHVRNLETRLGLRLCDRGRGGFRLTEAGEAVLVEARQLLAASEGFSARVAGLRDRLAGPVRLGLLDAMVTDPAARLPDALAHYAATAPQSEIRMVCRPPDELLRDLSAGALDAAVGSFPRIALGLDYVDLYSERHSFFCGRGHPLYDMPDAAIGHEEVRHHRLIGRSYWGTRDLKDFASHRVGATVADMESEALLILSGGFLGFLPDHYAASWVARGEMRAVAPARFGYEAPFQLAYKAERLRVPRVAALVEALLAPHGRRLPARQA